MARLFAVMTSVLVIIATSISSSFGLSTRMGGGALHGSEIYRDGAWGRRVAGRLTMNPSHPFCRKCSPVKVYRVLNKHLCVDRRCKTADKVVQNLCRHCILDMQQHPAECINIGLHCTLCLCTLNLLIPCPMSSINGHKLLLEEEFELLPS